MHNTPFGMPFQMGRFRDETPHKRRRIIIDIPTLHNEIDSATYKQGDARFQQQDVRVKNAVTSDASEKLDGMIIRRLTDYRDAQIRRRLAWCLASTRINEVNNIPDYKNKYIYALELPMGFNDNLLESLAAQIDEYMVKGALKDWYDECGMDGGDKYDLDRILTEIADTVRCSQRRVTLQPFGGAERFSGDDYFYKPRLNPTLDNDAVEEMAHDHHEHYHHHPMPQPEEPNQWDNGLDFTDNYKEVDDTNVPKL